MFTWFIFKYVFVCYVNLYHTLGLWARKSTGAASGVTAESHASPRFIRVMPSQMHTSQSVTFLIFICIEIWTQTDRPGSNPTTIPLTCLTVSKFLSLIWKLMDKDHLASYLVHKRWLMTVMGTSVLKVKTLVLEPFPHCHSYLGPRL